jgi:hypothetical protein
MTTQGQSEAAEQPRGAEQPLTFGFGDIWTALLQHVANNPDVRQRIVTALSDWIVNELESLITQHTSSLRATNVGPQTGAQMQAQPGQILVDGKPV